MTALNQESNTQHYYRAMKSNTSARLSRQQQQRQLGKVGCCSHKRSCTTTTRSRKNNIHNANSAISLHSLALISAFLASSSLAFSPVLSTSLRTNNNLLLVGRVTSSSYAPLYQARQNEFSTKALANLMKKDRLPFESEADIGDGISAHAGDPARQSWLRWMRAGTPRGSAEVKMREAWELGGVPRSDRYSSR